MILFLVPFYVALLWCLVAELWVWFAFWRNKNTSNKDKNEIRWILVLGCKGGITSPLVQDRALAASQFIKTFPEATLILSGNEDLREVSNLEALLCSVIVVKNLKKEMNSRTTWQNLVYTERLCQAIDFGKDPGVVITNEFHQPRVSAMMMALGWKAQVAGKDQKRYQMRRLFFFKERLAIYKNFGLMIFAWLRSTYQRCRAGSLGEV